MILKDGKEYYPLGFGHMVRDGKTYYDRSARQKSWFYLDLRGPFHQVFAPAGSTGLVTADGEFFKTII